MKQIALRTKKRYYLTRIKSFDQKYKNFALFYDVFEGTIELRDLTNLSFSFEIQYMHMYHLEHSLY